MLRAWCAGGMEEQSRSSLTQCKTISDKVQQRHCLRRRVAAESFEACRSPVADAAAAAARLLGTDGQRQLASCALDLLYFCIHQSRALRPANQRTPGPSLSADGRRCLPKQRAEWGRSARQQLWHQKLQSLRQRRHQHGGLPGRRTATPTWRRPASACSSRLHRDALQTGEQVWWRARDEWAFRCSMWHIAAAAAAAVRQRRGAALSRSL